MAYVLKNDNGEPVKRDGDEVFASDVFGSVKAVNKDNRTLVIVGSDETKDRDGDVIMVSGWDMENFLKNPVFLFAHDHRGVPIGSATKVVRRKNPPRLEFHEKFPSEGVYPFADMILTLFHEKVMNASSVGFIPKKWEDLPKDEDEAERWFPGRRFTKQELLELSAVAVPSNPSAVQVNSLAKSFMSKSMDEIREMMDPKDRDIILEELASKSIEFEDEDRPFIIQVVDNISSEASSEEFLTVKGESEEKETNEISEEVEDEMDIKELFESILEKLETIEEDQAALAEEMVGIKSFITNLTKAEESVSDENEVDGETDPVEEKSEETIYDEILSQKDNKDEVEEDELGLSAEEREMLSKTINDIKSKIKLEEKE